MCLSLMDWLTPDDTLNHLAPLECALFILAAYTHDLGMALTREEYAQTSQRLGFLIGTRGFRSISRPLFRTRFVGFDADENIGNPAVADCMNGIFSPRSSKR